MYEMKFKTILKFLTAMLDRQSSTNGATFSHSIHGSLNFSFFFHENENKNSNELESFPQQFI
jgi:hypothetical protein